MTKLSYPGTGGFQLRFCRTFERLKPFLFLSVLLMLTIVMLVPSGTVVWAFDRDDDEEDETLGGHHDRRTCSGTAQAALRACRHDAKDNFWIAYGKCLNDSHEGNLRECLRDAQHEHREARTLCHQQKKSRLEICTALGEGPYDPEINPAEFLSPAAAAATPNPYFPLVPGLVRVLQAGDETITVTVTEETKEILGVTCTVIRDVVEEHGETIEDTIDWYAQDIFGNVWYFGEIAKNFENGELANLDGSWTGGVDGAKPGIIMKANPEVGDIYRQEFALGEAEDMARVIATTETQERAPAADCADRCVVTHDFLPIDPGHVEKKFYAPGIGNILVIDLDTGKREELIQVIQP